MLDLPPRQRKPTNRYAPHGDDVSVGEVVTAEWLDGNMYDGKVAGVRDDGTLAIDFDDGDRLAGVKRRAVLRSSNGASAADKARSSKKSKAKPRGPADKVRWAHHGISNSTFSPQPQHASVAESLMFEYDASFKVHNQMGPRVTSKISLHDIVNGDMPIAEKNMHVRALSDFMKTLLLCTPSADNMHELIESTGIDPMGSMRASGRASAASCSRHLAQLREGRIFGGFTAPNGIHRWIRIRGVRNHLISTQASGSGLGAARGSTPRFGTQNSLPCIAWRSWRRGRVSPRF